MPRILGVDLPKEKKIKISLRYLYGIGSISALQTLKAVNIDPEKRAKELSDEEVAQLTTYIQAHRIKTSMGVRPEKSSMQQGLSGV